MTKKKASEPHMQSMTTVIGQCGYWCGLAAATATISYVVVQGLQVAGALRYPLDEVLIYATSLCIVVPFLLEILALHHLTEFSRRFWTHGALLFTILYAVFVTSNYVVQLATVIPSKLQEAAGDIAILEQTPHSLFWNYDAVGYISMGLATLIAIPAFDRSGFDRWVRMSFLAHAIVTPLITVVYFYPAFSETLLWIGSPWAITAPLFMILLAIRLRRERTTIR
jgi:hypothetical protein